MKRFFIIMPAAALFFMFIYTGCKCPSCERQEETVVPVEILKRGNDFISNRTGKEFFEKYITPDFVLTKFHPPYYELTYRLHMTEKPYVDEIIEFSIDTLGKIALDRDIIGVPDCINGECTFNIKEEEAVKIAKDNGLEKGVKDWKTGFMWNAKLSQYVWNILSTTAESKSSEGYRGNGKEVVIDPNSGLVLEMNDWFVK